jgi:Tol biopolymer transport system component
MIFKLKMRMPRLIVYLFVFLIGLSCNHDPARGKVRINYPAKKMASQTAELFAPGVISTDSTEHSSPTFSPDGKTVLWSIVEIPSWKASLLEMNYENGNWSAPQRPSFSDTTASDIYPSFAPDGTLYFSSGRKLPSGLTPAKGNVIWRVNRSGTGWGVPQPLDSMVSKGGDYSPSISTRNNLYFTHGPFRSPNWDIMVAELANGSHVTPIRVTAINTDGYEDGAFIAEDERYLVFESDRPGGIDGSIDLYISFKSENGEWEAPINMGPSVNTNASERFARVSPDGRFMFFGSNRRQVKGKPNFDIYWIDASIITALRETLKK